MSLQCQLLIYLLNFRLCVVSRQALKPSKAILAYEKALMWQELFDVALQESMSEEDLSALAYRVAGKSGFASAGCSELTHLDQRISARRSDTKMPPAFCWIMPKTFVRQSLRLYKGTLSLKLVGWYVWLMA